jgi:hypothetical protein
MNRRTSLETAGIQRRPSVRFSKIITNTGRDVSKLELSQMPKSAIRSKLVFEIEEILEDLETKLKQDYKKVLWML